MLDFLKKLFSYSKYVVFVLLLAAVGTLLTLWLLKARQANQLEQAMETYKRQLSGQLTEKEQELQAAHLQLGIAQSKLLTQEALTEQYKREKFKTSEEFEQFKKKHNIEIESFHKTIAKLEQQIKNGTTVVVVEPGNNTPRTDGLIDPKKDKLRYNWKSNDGRFELDDQDVFTPNNETFKLKQTFRIVGEVYREKVGFLKTSKLSIEEVVIDGKNSDGTPKYKTVGEAQVVESSFKYTERAPDYFMPRTRWYGAWGLVGAHLSVHNLEVQRFLVSTGVRFLQWPKVGLGLNTQLFIDTGDVKESGWGLGIDYRPVIKETQLNVGLGFSVHTPFNSNFGREYFYNFGLLFYLW